MTFKRLQVEPFAEWHWSVLLLFLIYPALDLIDYLIASHSNCSHSNCDHYF